jgi:HK97 family phage prohead protease
MKAVHEDGTFEGYLSVYGLVDLGNDVVEKGAFTKTIQEQKGVVPLLWAHDSKTPLGALTLTDDDHGLAVKGEFFLEESAKAREMHAMSKRFMEKGRAMGLSIGYEAIRKVVKEGVRHLKELRLHEGSLTLFPMLPAAQMTSIKSADGEEKEDFATVLQRAQVYAMRGMICNSLMASLDSITYQYGEEKMDAEAKIAASEESIDQFRAAYMQHLPALLEMWGEKDAPEPEQKAGRRISATSRAQIEEAITKLQALLTDDDATSAEDADAGKSNETPPPLQDSTAPGPDMDAELHLMLKNFTFEGIKNG